MSKRPAERIAYSIAETAAMFGVTTNHLRARIDAGEIRSIRMGRRVLIPKIEIDRVVTGARIASSPSSDHRAT
jgi:excisionase family DNA binding protein